MSPRDWIEIGVLTVLTVTSIGRWIEAREQKEKQLGLQSTNGLSATRADLAAFEARHSEEHERLWTEINRSRDHWHKEMIPWQQRMAEKVAMIEGAIRQLDRRRQTRE